jgi:hypothetical protein
LPTRNYDDEFGAPGIVELLDDRSVATAFLFIVCDGALVAVVVVLIFGCGLAGSIRSVE